MFIVGPPGSGKSMIAMRMPSIMTELDNSQRLEVQAIRSVLGQPPVAGVPIVAPHHGVSVAGLLGGGSGRPLPGAVSLAHHGVLFLDEVSEMAASVLDSLRVPLEEVKSWETGRETTRTALCTPWFQFPAEIEKPEYLAMNLYESVQPVVGAFFPLWRKTVLYREAALERVRADGEACRREALAAAETRLKEALRGNEIIDKWVDYCMIEGEFFAVSMTGEWRTEIGEPAT